MPTDYTSVIYEGQDVSGREFIKRCARAFGAYVEMRDEPLDAEVKEHFEPRSYHQEQINNTISNLEKLYTMSLEEAQSIADDEYSENIRYTNEQIYKKQELKNRYESVLSEVKKWHPPTDDHKKLKEYCIEQLTMSIDADCDINYYTQEIKYLSGQEWLNVQISGCLRDLEYHSKHQREENERTEERNKWIEQLNDSLRGF